MLFIIGSYQINAQSACTVPNTLSGNTATFSMLWPLPLIYTLDSVHFDFGDGNNTAFYNPVPVSTTHTYAAPGLYTYCVTRYISQIGVNIPIICTYCDSIFIGSTSSCFVSANYSTTFPTSLTASFSNTTTCTSCTSLTYLWNFGDGNTSTANSPTHSYLAPGVYNVCLYATGVNPNNVTCIDTFCTTITITQGSSGCIANANFTASSTGLNAAFANSSTCTSCVSTVYNWSFGDGNTSGVQNPTHTYALPGTYNVCLVVLGVDAFNNTCIDSFCQTLTVGSVLPCQLTVNFTESISSFTANFTNNSTCTGCNVTNYYWSFGDGNTGTTSGSAPISHTYTAPGTYNVCLVGIDTFANIIRCQDSACHNIVVMGNAVSDAAINSLKIYPNPVNGVLQIDLPINEKTEAISIKDVSGRVVYKNVNVDNNSKTVKIDMKMYNSGIYFINLQTDKQNYTSSIVNQE